jgi:hypothetical protein
MPVKVVLFKKIILHLYTNGVTKCDFMCKQTKNPDIRIKRIMLANYRELRHIGINKYGESNKAGFSVFMKQVLTQIAESFPADLKKEKKLSEKEIKNEVAIHGISAKTHVELKNIADNLAVCLGCLIKIESKKISSSYPERLKQKPLDG